MFTAESWKKSAEEASKVWEQAASRWWDETVRDPKTLEGMGTFLDALCAAKERTDRSLDEHWSRWRLASATDVQRIHERLGEVQAQLDRIESLLAAGLVEAGAEAPRA